MSNRNQIEQQVITTKFTSEWVPKFPNVPVKYENRNFTPPDNQPWVSFSIRSGRVAEAAISAIMPRGIGIVYLQIFMPENAGTMIGRQLADGLADVFDNWHYVYAATTNPRGDLWFKRVEVVPQPIRDGWVNWVASVEFKHDEQVIVPAVTGGIPEAPTDGSSYARRNGGWTTALLGISRTSFPIVTVAANGATAIDWTQGEVQKVTLQGNAQLSIGSWPATGLAKLVLDIHNTGAFNITSWPTGTVWPGGTVPTITSGAGKRDVIALMSLDGGTTVLGSVIGQNYA
jgi:Bacteriophage related domain of unknown function